MSDDSTLTTAELIKHWNDSSRSPRPSCSHMAAIGDELAKRLAAVPEPLMYMQVRQVNGKVTIGQIPETGLTDGWKRYALMEAES